MNKTTFKLKSLYHKIMRDGCFPVKYTLLTRNVRKQTMDVFHEIEFAPKGATNEWIERNMFAPWLRQQFSVKKLHYCQNYYNWSKIKQF